MSENEELEEHAHEAKEPFDKLVAASMALIAALLAVVSVLGQHYQTEAILDQQHASDQWAYSQAKDIRHYIAQFAVDSLSQVKPIPAAVGNYNDDANKYKKQASDIQKEARDDEKERDLSEKKAIRFHIGEVFLEVAIVFSSLAILTKFKPLFYLGLVCALGGIIVGGTGLMVEAVVLALV
jgi:hypothetical protein